MNPEDQKTAFIALPALEKAQVWIAHLNQFEKSLRLSNDQKVAVDLLISKLQPSIFIFNSTENNGFKNEEPVLHKKFINLFGDQLSKKILNSLQNVIPENSSQKIQNAYRITVTPNVTTIPECTCSSSSDYCSCPSGDEPYHCPWCQSSNCKTSSWGCGTLFFYSCGGICQGYQGGE